MPDAKINDATLAGIDTARIGIRDDVHIWIYDTYSSTKKRTRLMTMGKSLHKILATRPMTEDQAKNIDQSFKEASQELRTIPGLLPVEAETMDTLLYEHTFNTSERLKTYLDYSLLLPADPTLK